MVMQAVKAGKGAERALLLKIGSIVCLRNLKPSAVGVVGGDNYFLVLSLDTVECIVI